MKILIVVVATLLASFYSGDAQTPDPVPEPTYWDSVHTTRMSHTVCGLPPGRYPMYVVAVDSAGQYSEPSDTVWVDIE